MAEPTFISSFEGIHNRDLKRARERLKKAKAYTDLSTVVVIPTRGVVPARVVESWWNLQTPMNQKLVRIFVAGAEVGDAYEQAVEIIRNTPGLDKFRYMLTLEEDNMPPPDGLMRLLETICSCKTPCTDHYSVVAGLYWTKGEDGMPMVYGNPKEMLAFNPQQVRPNSVQECNGTGMGFTLYHMGLFREIERPWFKTVQGPEGLGTQDLYFAGKARRQGFRIASDNRVRVGHYDLEGDRVW